MTYYSWDHLNSLCGTKDDFHLHARSVGLGPEYAGHHVIRVLDGWVYWWGNPSMSTEKLREFLKEEYNIDENSLFSDDPALRRLIKELYFPEENNGQ